MLLWSPPDLPGSSRITGYTWVEFIAGRAVLTGDNIPLTFSDDGAGGGVNASEVAAELSGYSKGYGIIPGALAACFGLFFPGCILILAVSPFWLRIRDQVCGLEYVANTKAHAPMRIR